ncbi:MAG: sigma-70 family RNA polymerase sigma factor [Planctomycetes bacterium]|nr:sigma-70 family RNA polymerase sigma factor [Planctomycetota bacterium]
MSSLQTLLAAASAGDPAARDRVAGHVLPDVRRLVHHQIQRRLRRPGAQALARLSTGDVVQEVLVEVVSRLDRWQASNEEAFIGMLATLVEHRLTDLLRHHHAGIRDARRHDEHGADTAGVTDDRTPSAAALEHEAQAIYREVLAAFTDRERALLALRLEDRAGFDEIAARLAFPTGDAARKAFHTVKAHLAVRLAARGLGADPEANS